MKIKLSVLFCYLLSTATVIFGQQEYYVSKKIKVDFSSIHEVNNAKLNEGDKVYFKSGEQFSDAILECKKGVIYTTYDGNKKAIIGDTTADGFSNVIVVNQVSVQIVGLELQFYKNCSTVIQIKKGNLKITNCDIFGSHYAHLRRGVGISVDYEITDPISIERNVIRDFDKCIELRTPYNIDIGYNTIYNAYRYDGHAHNGAAGKLIDGYLGSKYINFSSDYTLRIHHNNFFNWEHSAINFQSLSRYIVEYNEFHHNLDERLYFGGTEMGMVAKITDDAGLMIGALGALYRYNYFHNIYKYGKIGTTYLRPNIEQIRKGEIQIKTTNNGETSNLRYENTDGTIDYIGIPNGLLQVVGYSHSWFHNNLFYHIDRNIFRRATYKDKKSYRNDFPTYFVNNTLLDIGFKSSSQTQMRSLYGVIQIQDLTYAPNYIYNNIFDAKSKLMNGVITSREEGAYIDNNIYLNQDGRRTTKTAPYSDVGNAAYFYKTIDPLSSNQDKYMTDPEWQDPSSMIFVASIGPNGTYIPNVYIRENGNAHNTGKHYNQIGDNLLDNTNVNIKGPFIHEMGKDPTGRSLAYDLLGNYRTTNDIGAFGIAEVNAESPPPTNTVPIILTQPMNISAEAGGSAAFSINATCTGEIGYQWWKSPYISDSESKIEDNDKYSGATTNKLTIKNVNADDISTSYVCEVYNINDHSNSWVNSNTVSIQLNTSNASSQSGFRVILEASYKSNKMTSSLYNAKVFPLNQPYNTAPWNLKNEDKIDQIKSEYIEWLLVELRENINDIKYRKTAILDSDGTVLNSDGTDFSFNNIISGNYFIVVHHRNHLSVMSADKVNIVDKKRINYDFTKSPTSAYGKNSLANLGDGIFGMYAGDGDGNGVINNLDFGAVANNIFTTGYLLGDLDMNGIVNVLDYSLINSNIFKKSNVPK